MDAQTEAARQLFSADRYATEQTGIEILEAASGYAKCRVVLDDRHKNAMGQVMGGVFFTLADFTFAIASNFMQSPTVTQTSQIVYLCAVKGNVLFAETEQIRTGKKSCFYKILITDDTGAQVAYVTTSGVIMG